MQNRTWACIIFFSGDRFPSTDTELRSFSTTVCIWFLALKPWNYAYFVLWSALLLCLWYEINKSLEFSPRKYVTDSNLENKKCIQRRTFQIFPATALQPFFHFESGPITDLITHHLILPSTEGKLWDDFQMNSRRYRTNERKKN